MKPLVLRRILLATDLGADTLPAAESARQLAALSGAELHIVHSTETVTDPARIEEQIAAWVQRAGGDLEVNVLQGPAGALITQEAARTEADVIIIGRHRNRAGNPGSTADRVARTARVPCLILPAGLGLPIDSVLVPVDVNAAARGGLHAALTWASALKRRAAENEVASTLHVLHVRSSDARESEGAREQLKTEVDAIAGGLANVAGVRIEQHVEVGDIADTIMRGAAAHRAGLIVIGTRAKRVTDDPLGSVSAAVVKAATGPVLLVPPEVWRSST